MIVRKFELLNALGVSFDLMRRDAFLSAPEGLGVSYKNNFARVGGSYVLTHGEISQPEISGVMLFKDYSVYTEFKNHVARQPLKLLYEINDVTYTIDCVLGDLEKSEISSRTGRLECEISLECTSQWYIRKEPLWTAEVDQVGGKIYDYTYDYTYQEALMNQIQMRNASNLDSPVIITIYGPVVNPSWRCLVNGQAVQSGSITGSIPDGHKLRINSIDDALEIAEYTNADEYYQDVYQKVDFGKSNFVYIPPGNSIISFTSSDGANVSASVELMELYETV